jgi:hypothetical protein
MTDLVRFRLRRAVSSGVVAAFGSLWLAACAQPQAPPPPASVPVADAQALFRQIRDEIGEPTCSSAAQCRSTPVGHKACGGPEAYVVWSTTVSDGTRLRQLIDAYTRARQDDNQRSGRISDCSMVTDPGARCEAGRCVAGPAARPVM